ncbi:hypothetical protein EMPS_10878 [Entomortierella parvispora]|uniref:PH domain-containing protein n=1 Tax=Entomortierella parvispora TaxID=205924 RepID=A0A9P3M1L5_9FUNG|nr:hypothetical protein EMPS_10878 [Entomortierella parvispora]
MNPRGSSLHLVGFPDNPVHHYRGMNKNICWSPDAFEMDVDLSQAYQSSRLVSNTDSHFAKTRSSTQTKAGTLRETTSTTSSSIFDLEVHSDSTLYSHAPACPNPNQSLQPQKPQQLRNENKMGKKTLGFLRNSSSSQNQENSSRNSDDMLYWSSQPPSIVSGQFPAIPAAPSFQSIFNSNGPSNSNKDHDSDRYETTPLIIMDDRVLMEDWLQKRSASLQLVWRRRWCILKNDCLFYYRSNMETKPIGILNLADYSLLTFGPDISRRSKLAFRLSLTAVSPSESTLDNEPIGTTPLSSTPALTARSSGGVTTAGSQEMNQQQHHLFHAQTQEALDLWVKLIQTCIDRARMRQRDARKKASGNSRTYSSDQINCLAYGYRCELNSDQRCSRAQPIQEGRSIIDKVLDRLLLEDPTLSDINDPSTLIMPTQEQSSGGASVRSLQMCVDDGLDAWSSRSPSFLYTRDKGKSRDGSHDCSTPPRGAHISAMDANTASSISNSDFSFGDSLNRYGNHSMEEQLMCTESLQLLLPHSQSAASSSAGVSDVRRTLRPPSITSRSSQDHREVLYTKQPYGKSSAVQLDGKDRPLALQTLGLPPLPSINTVDPPISIANRRVFSRSSPLTATNVASPEYYILEVDHPYQDRSASLASTSTIGSSSSGGSFMAPTTVVNGMGLNEEAKASYRGSLGNYVTGHDLSAATTIEKETKGAAALPSSPKKIKKLWSVYGTSSSANFDVSVLKSEPTAITSNTEDDFPGLSENMNGSEISNNNNNSRRSTATTSEALDVSNPLLQGLVLVAPTSLSKRGGYARSSNNVKGNSFSKSLTSLSNKETCKDPFTDSGAHKVPVPPQALSAWSSNSSSINLVPRTQASYSNSVMDNNHQRQNQQCLLDSTRTRSSTTNDLSSRGAVHTAPISPMPSEWTARERSERHALYQSTQMRCVDPELLVSALSLSFHSQGSNAPYKNKNPFGADISRQIVPTEELVLAIAQEAAAEELLKRQQELDKDSTEQPSKKGGGYKHKKEDKSDSSAETSPADQVKPTALITTLRQEKGSFAPAIPIRSPHRALVPVNNQLYHY